MTKEERLKEFEIELGFIESPEIKEFVETMIGELPDYFFSIPASSTGKYHPQYALGAGGLLRHTKSAVRIAKELFTIFPQYTQYQKDCIISALILHDGCKSGKDGGTYTAYDHPLQVVSLIKDDVFPPIMRSEKYFIEDICELISTHMGQWNKDYKGNEILPIPKTKTQNFVHMCDYLASRKFLEFNFNNYGVN